MGSSSDSETSDRGHRKYKHKHKAKLRSRSKSFSDSENERHYLKHRRHSRSPRRSRSPDRNVQPERHYHEKDKGYFSEAVNFSFESYRHELREVFLKRFNLVSDVDDFWKFVKNYETMQKRSGVKTIHQTLRGESAGNNPLGIPAEYDKMHLVGISLNINVDQLQLQLPPETKLTKQQLLEFQDILLLYLNFKQKERFTKLRKLRQNQANLPVAQYREQIVSAVRREKVVIIAGDTGCGKSTQVPQYLLKDGYRRIACTQPRRIACISLCKRVAFETLNEYGSEIGYQIRFEKSKTQHTRIIFITEGLLLRQVSTDPSLSNYDVLVLDEVHERHLHGDFLLGVVKCLLYQRPELKVILMSATINIQLFQDYFLEEATIIQVPGRLYPIKLQYRPVSIEEKTSKSERINPAPYVRIMQLIDEKYPKEEKGDLLIFLSGMSEISTIVEAAKLYAQQNQGWIVLPLHSTLSLSEQDKVFDYPPDGVRKCIVSTNIAETSVTIDGIRFVVDSGKVKEMSYDPVCKMQRLKEFWISQASAEQRKGRAGRTGPGVCYRLYSEEKYSEMSQYSTPEIQRVPLDTLLLQMVAMGLPNARKFPFIEPPPADSIENSIISLKQQGALTENEKLTTVGRMLSRLPVDIAIGKMLIMGSLFHQAEPVLSLAAALSVQSPFTNKAYRDPDCETSRKELESDHGDPITLLNALREWLEVKHNASSNRSGVSSRQWCRRRGLEEQRFYEMIKLRRQFKELLQDAGLLQSDKEPTENMSSAERALRHGEIKLLRSMQRSYKEATPLKKRTLKLDVWELEKETDEPGDIDIKDVEFRLSNDYSQLQLVLLHGIPTEEEEEVSHKTDEEEGECPGKRFSVFYELSEVTGTTACSYKDLTMLKLILSSGLYPQFAIADEFNHCKSVSEQLFHTFGKPYVALHPMSFFGNHPQVLQLEDSDIHVPQEPGFKSKGPLSSKHQLLCYLSLLETTKPFLVTTMRMPAAQTLLLLSQSIDTSYDFSRLVCDSWLQLDFPSPDIAATLLLKAANLRNKWDKLLTLRLEGTSVSVTNKEKAEVTAHALEKELSTELPQFMRTEVCYTIHRLLPADMKVLYVGPGDEVLPIDPNPFHPEWEVVQHPTKGGMQVSPYLTYNCLAKGGAVQSTLNDEEEDDMFKCPQCDMPVGGEPIQRIQHTQSCQQSQHDAAKEDSHAERKPNAKDYECPECSKTLYLTPIEILRHKKQHVK